MSTVKEAKSKTSSVETKASLGRKRDDTLDARLIESAIDVIAEVGFDGMTMDMVATRAKAGKAGVYRRWASKAELVRDALISMSQSSIELGRLPDTGTLRGDLLAVLKPFSTGHGEKKYRVLGGLGSFFTAHRKASEEALAGIFEPWTIVNRSLMSRAIERGEIPDNANIEMVCQLIISTTVYRTLMQSKPFDKAYYGALLDNILLPALKNPGSTGRK